MIKFDIENCFSPACAGTLLRPTEEPDAPFRYSALASGWIMVLNASPRILVNGVERSSTEKGENLLSGIFVARNVFVRDGREFPTPRVGDLIAMRVTREAVTAFEVVIAGIDGLRSDEVILDHRPGLGAVAEMRVDADDPAAARRYLQQKG